uniref:PHD-type domain-containing protein n=1 Tax=Chromera velia CCMP2878 TaxID=1169474 RepID=A0A0G4HPW9_9ALVE|eukprot:Cvel_1227.t1-p1 / transcript=Cvel_1227.t1 / gene=Cvel_1227 / organism=Chromera_velia_CCMP2878 / gene_product=hypothetical protein / transcript_product=hypothetical protein / location=Cvel_scaffold41:21015-29752(-) / protein_length=1319 / sequence_SO=supercontig / SO=protein_coding / is_pseudo=false
MTTHLDSEAGVDFVGEQEEELEEGGEAEEGGEEEGEDNDVVCLHCGTGGQLLCCDFCARSYHVRCLGLPGIPKGKDWGCSWCEGNEYEVKQKAYSSVGISDSSGSSKEQEGTAQEKNSSSQVLQQWQGTIERLRDTCLGDGAFAPTHALAHLGSQLFWAHRYVSLAINHGVDVRSNFVGVDIAGVSRKVRRALGTLSVEEVHREDVERAGGKERLSGECLELWDRGFVTLKGCLSQEDVEGLYDEVVGAFNSSAFPFFCLLPQPRLSFLRNSPSPVSSPQSVPACKRVKEESKNVMGRRLEKTVIGNEAGVGKEEENGGSQQHETARRTEERREEKRKEEKEEEKKTESFREGNEAARDLTGHTDVCRSHACRPFHLTTDSEDSADPPIGFLTTPCAYMTRIHNNDSLRNQLENGGGFDLIKTRGELRFDVSVPALMQKPEKHKGLHAKTAKWLSVCREALRRRGSGGDFAPSSSSSSSSPPQDTDELELCHLGCMLTRPGCAIQGLHTDGPHDAVVAGEVAAASEKEKGKGKATEELDRRKGGPRHEAPYALNVFLPLVNVKRDVGPTEFYPGSHYLWHYWGGGDENANRQRGRPEAPLLKAGDALVFDYRVLHRGLGNRSGIVRPVLYLTYCRKGDVWRDRENFASDRFPPLFPLSRSAKPAHPLSAPLEEDPSREEEREGKEKGRGSQGPPGSRKRGGGSTKAGAPPSSSSLTGTMRGQTGPGPDNASGMSLTLTGDAYERSGSSRRGAAEEAERGQAQIEAEDCHTVETEVSNKGGRGHEDTGAERRGDVGGSMEAVVNETSEEARRDFLSSPRGSRQGDDVEKGAADPTVFRIEGSPLFVPPIGEGGIEEDAFAEQRASAFSPPSQSEERNQTKAARKEEKQKEATGGKGNGSDGPSKRRRVAPPPGEPSASLSTPSLVLKPREGLTENSPGAPQPREGFAYFPAGPGGAPPTLERGDVIEFYYHSPIDGTPTRESDGGDVFRVCVDRIWDEQITIQWLTAVTLGGKGKTRINEGSKKKGPVWDFEGCPCAIAFLMQSADNTALASRIDDIAHTNLLLEMATDNCLTSDLSCFASDNGLTVSELAMIQPGYGLIVGLQMYCCFHWICVLPTLIIICFIWSACRLKFFSLQDNAAPHNSTDSLNDPHLSIFVWMASSFGTSAYPTPCEEEEAWARHTFVIDEITDRRIQVASLFALSFLYVGLGGLFMGWTVSWFWFSQPVDALIFLWDVLWGCALTFLSQCLLLLVCCFMTLFIDDKKDEEVERMNRHSLDGGGGVQALSDTGATIGMFEYGPVAAVSTASREGLEERVPQEAP